MKPSAIAYTFAAAYGLIGLMLEIGEHRANAKTWEKAVKADGPGTVSD
jgi:hypothetical protein